MKQKTKNIIKKIRKNRFVRIPLGILFVLLGFIGGFIPIFQGWIFMFIGLVILFGPEVINIKKLREKRKEK